ncbi:hypothetical protein LY78DRAFT_650274 [Colletotrichum sublineola]|nr:hypothetical protein LY78DRAFT_650274 [Colletotrichum sublineola]
MDQPPFHVCLKKLNTTIFPHKVIITRPPPGSRTRRCHARPMRDAELTSAPHLPPNLPISLASFSRSGQKEKEKEREKEKEKRRKRKRKEKEVTGDNGRPA